MPYQFESSAAGPLADLLGHLNLPISLTSSSKDNHHMWLLADSEDNSRKAWVLLSEAAAAAAQTFQPRFQTLEDWLPGMTVMFDRNSNISGSASAEVSALWTNLTAPLKNVIAGDIGLDLDLGLHADAAWQAQGRLIWVVERPLNAPSTLRLRLNALSREDRKISVSGKAVAGLDQATQNTIAALAGRHRNQILARLRRNLKDKVQGVSRRKLDDFLNEWEKLDPGAQSAAWAEAASPVIKKLRQHIDALPDAAVYGVERLTARLEYAAIRLVEKRVSASITATFEKWESSDSLLDAVFDFGYPGVQQIFEAVLGGDIGAALNQRHPGVRVNAGVIATELTRRQTFEWRLPWASSATTAEFRMRTAMEVLDTETGRIIKDTAQAESHVRTRKAASLLQLEGAFASLLSDSIIVHNPALLRARFEMRMRADQPGTLLPLLSLYGLAMPDGTPRECRLVVDMPPESLSHWLEPRDEYDLARTIQSAWRALLPALVDFEPLPDESISPLLTWASLPVTTGARRENGLVRLNVENQTYWDYRDPELKEAMIWNPRTKAALEARLHHLRVDFDADEARRLLRHPVSAALFQGLLHTEAQIVDRVCSTASRASRLHKDREANAVESMRSFGLMLAGLADAFHRRLSSVYGREAARALGPMLLTATSGIKPQADVEWVS